LVPLMRKKIKSKKLGHLIAGKALEGATLVITLVKGLANTVGANGIFVVIVGDVAVLAVLVVVLFVTPSLPSC
jgi:hypothetical protein